MSTKPDFISIFFAFLAILHGTSTATTISSTEGRIQPLGFHLKFQDVVGTEIETIETVRELLKGPFSNTIDVVTMNLVTKPDVFEYLLRNVFDGEARGEVAFRVLSEKFQVKTSLDFQPGSNELAIFKCCLEEISKSNKKSQYFADFYCHFIVYAVKGKVEVVRAFIDAGFKVDPEVQGTFPFGLFVIQGNFEATVKELVRGGMLASNTAKSIGTYIGDPMLTPSLLEFLFENGLPVKHKLFGLNWMELCLDSNRPDLGFIVYKQGIKLNSQCHVITSKKKEFLHALALKIAQEDAYKWARLLFAAVADPESDFDVFPKEIVMEQIRQLLECLNVEDYIPLLFE